MGSSAEIEIRNAVIACQRIAHAHAQKDFFVDIPDSCAATPDSGAPITDSGAPITDSGAPITDSGAA